MSLSMIETWVADGDVDAVAAVVVDAQGVRELHAAGGAREDSLFALASVTKPMTAVAVLVAAEEGALDLDAPVAEHVAEYADPARATITARHLLAHASGLPETVRDVPPLEVRPSHPPATRRIYSNEGFHVLGELLTRATGIDYREYVREAVFEPLGMDAHLPLPVAEAARALAVEEPGLVGQGLQLFNAPEWRARGTAAGGAFATVEAVGRLLSVLLAGGRPLLSPQTTSELATVQWPGLEGGLESYPKLQCPDWGLGVNIRALGYPHWCGDAVSPSTISHFGASGTLAWADPAAGLGLACLASHSTYNGWMMRPGRWADLSAAVLAA